MGEFVTANDDIDDFFFHTRLILCKLLLVVYKEEEGHPEGRGSRSQG